MCVKIKESFRPRSRGTTLLELLVVVAIIMILLSLIAVVTAKVREMARRSNATSLVHNIKQAMIVYNDRWHEYPSTNTAKDTEPDPFDYKGVELDSRLLTAREPGSVFQISDLCPAHPYLFLDPWSPYQDAGHSHIRYRKVNRERMLIWSYGPNQKDEIGIGKLWDDAAKPAAYKDPPEGNQGGKLERLGDDISSAE